MTKTICFDNHPNALPDDRLEIKKSPIHGHGIFTKEILKTKEDLGISHVIVGGQMFRTPLGGYLNHSFEPNCDIIVLTEQIHALRTNRLIPAGEELTVDYTYYKCGEGAEVKELPTKKSTMKLLPRIKVEENISNSIKEVRTKEEAQKFFLENSSGSCQCVKGDRLKVVDNYIDAVTFFNSFDFTVQS